METIRVIKKNSIDERDCICDYEKTQLCTKIKFCIS